MRLPAAPIVTGFQEGLGTPIPGLSYFCSQERCATSSPGPPCWLAGSPTVQEEIVQVACQRSRRREQPSTVGHFHQTNRRLRALHGFLKRLRRWVFEEIRAASLMSQTSPCSRSICSCLGDVSGSGDSSVKAVRPCLELAVQISPGPLSVKCKSLI
jgi:hypothetical protein